MRAKRFGLVGFGQMGRHHFRVLNEIEHLELVGVADPFQTSGESSIIVPSVDELIDRGIDCAVVAVPTSAHQTVATKLAEAGVNCLIEKPVAHNLESAYRIRDAFAASKAFCAVGHIERFNPAIRELRRLIRLGVGGKVLQISTTRMSNSPGRVADVGCTIDLASHDIDSVLWIVGGPYSRLAGFTGPSETTREDYLFASGEMNPGLLVNHAVNWNSPLKIRETWIWCEDGAFKADTKDVTLTFFPRAGSKRLPLLPDQMGEGEPGAERNMALDKVEPLRAELENFIKFVEGAEDTDIATLDEGISVMEVVKGILEFR